MKSILLFRVERASEQPEVEVLIGFVAADDLDESECDRAFQDEIQRDLWPDQVLLVVRERAIAGIKQKFQGSPTMRALLSRFPPGMTLAVSGFDAKGKETKREILQGTQPVHLTYADFQNQIMTRIFVDRGGLVRANDTYHFQNPSDRHTAQFMRLSNALVRHAEISFFAFCLLQFVPTDVKVVYVDTPALIGVVAAVSDHQNNGIRAPLISESFGSYNGLHTYGLTRASDAVVLISASSSGNLARRVLDKEPMLQPDRVVHVVFLGKMDAETRSACDLTYDQAKNPDGIRALDGDFKSGNCALCNRGSVPIPLRGEQFDIEGPRRPVVLLGENDAPSDYVATFARLVGSGSFQISLGGPTSRLPRQFDISPAELLKAPGFNTRLNYMLGKCVPASTQIVISLDPDSEQLAARVKDSTGRTDIRIVDRDELRLMDAASSTGAVVIAAAVVESGRSLQDVSRDLRTSFPNAPQTYIIGFAKPSSAQRLKTLKDSLIRTSQATYHDCLWVDSLPFAPAAKSNAWIREREFLERTLNSHQNNDAIPASSRERLTARLRRLGQTAQSLRDDLFVGNLESRPLRLQHGFIFWPPELPDRPHTQADVYYTIATILQTLRANVSKPNSKALHADGLQQTLLDPANFGRFNDGIIQASLLRAALPHELNYSADPVHSSEISRIIRRVIESASRPRGEAAAEFLLAVLTGQLTVRKEDRVSLCAPYDEAPEFIEALMFLGRREV